ncbi:MAG: 1-acyl-sn-glycerol-3-phosphate acyltransferase [Treponema sp.]|nr:1-acyl-sn-glycerol-3-phosphate acyltransferase [Treponema sp.]
MSSFITLACLIWMVTLPSIFNILAYPISKRISMFISNYIVKTLAHRLFVILECYKNFHFIGYKENTENLPEQYMIISNHQSIIDIPCYMNYLRDKDLRFVAKAELARHIPLISEMLRVQEHCLVPRRASAVTAMKTITDFGTRSVERNQIPIIFPEGTRTRNGNVGKFYSAGFRKLAEATKLPIVLCALDGGWQISTLPKILTNLRNGAYRVKVLKVYEPALTKESQSKILEEAPLLIQKQLDEWRCAEK